MYHYNFNLNYTHKYRYYNTVIKAHVGSKLLNAFKRWLASIRGYDAATKLNKDGSVYLSPKNIRTMVAEMLDDPDRWSKEGIEFAIDMETIVNELRDKCIPT